MYFVNLAVKTKMHLDAPRVEDTDHQFFLDYYNLFPRLPKYSNIKFSHFKRKLQHSRVTKKSVEPIIEEFGNIVNNAKEDERTDIEYDNQARGKSTTEQD